MEVTSQASQRAQEWGKGMRKSTAFRQAQAAFLAKVSRCAAPGCQRLCTGKWCHQHRPAPEPQGSWKIAADIKQELAAQGESNRSIAGVLGVSHTQVSRDLTGTNVPGADPPQQESDGGTGTNVPPTPAAKAARTRTAHEEIAKALFDRPAIAEKVRDD